jgi:hypothetical protein
MGEAEGLSHPVPSASPDSCWGEGRNGTPWLFMYCGRSLKHERPTASGGDSIHASVPLDMF